MQNLVLGVVKGVVHIYAFINRMKVPTLYVSFVHISMLQLHSSGKRIVMNAEFSVGRGKGRGSYIRSYQ